MAETTLGRITIKEICENANVSFQQDMLKYFAKRMAQSKIEELRK